MITDSLVMHAIQDRYGHGRAAVLALQAGADMVMALGHEEEQVAAVCAIGDAIDDGSLALPALQRARNRVDALARRFPSRARDYAPKARAADDRLMRDGWALGLTVIGGALPPRIDRPLRVVTQRGVPGDGVSEAGVSGARVAALFERFSALDVVQVQDLATLDWRSLADDGRATVLVSNTRTRYERAGTDVASATACCPVESVSRAGRRRAGDCHVGVRGGRARRAAGVARRARRGPGSHTGAPASASARSLAAPVVAPNARQRIATAARKRSARRRSRTCRRDRTTATARPRDRRADNPGVRRGGRRRRASP